MVAWERVRPPKGQMRVVSGGARRHLFFPRVTLQSSRAPDWSEVHHLTHPVSLSTLSGWLSPLSRLGEHRWHNNPMQAPWENLSWGTLAPLGFASPLNMITSSILVYFQHVLCVCVSSVCLRQTSGGYTGHIWCLSRQLSGGRILTTCPASSGHKPAAAVLVLRGNPVYSGL